MNRSICQNCLYEVDRYDLSLMANFGIRIDSLSTLSLLRYLFSSDRWWLQDDAAPAEISTLSPLLISSTNAVWKKSRRKIGE